MNDPSSRGRTGRVLRAVLKGSGLYFLICILSGTILTLCELLIPQIIREGDNKVEIVKGDFDAVVELNKISRSWFAEKGVVEYYAFTMAKDGECKAEAKIAGAIVAVGAVVLNRVEHPSFPGTLSGVIYQSGAFSCLQDGQWDQPVSDSAYSAARDALNGWDPTGGAIYYFNPATATSSWIWSRPLIITIGKHRFCA